MRVEELMTREVITCHENQTLSEAVKLMWQSDVGFLPVVGSDGKPVGVITDRDACMAAFIQGKPLAQIGVRSAMSQRLATCRPESTIDEAEQTMSEFQVHRLPVIDQGGKVVGVLSINDLAHYAAGKPDEELEEEVALTLGAICHPRIVERRAGIA